MIKSLKTYLRLSKNDFSFLKSQCFYAKNLYNQSLYHCKETFRTKGKGVGFYELDKIMRTKKNLDDKVNYRLICKAKVSQKIIRQLSQNYDSFFKSFRDWKVNPSKYLNKPRPPKYIKGKYSNLIWDYQCFQVKNGYVYLTKELKIKLPKQLIEKGKVKAIKTITISYKNDRMKAVFTFEDNAKYAQIKSNKNVMAIDLGMNNLATCTTNGIIKPFVINGKPLKSINQYYNKNLSKNVSQLEKRNHQKWSKKLQRLTDKRNNKINDYLHKASKRIVDICVSNQISNVVVGNVSRSNNKINLGTKTNQNFVNLGLGQLIEKLKYKLACHNIKLTVREESYTSKTSFLDNEKIAKAEKYVGKRAKRGLFISSKGLKINADVNGSYNILRKQTGFSINDLKSKVGNISAWVYPKKETLDSLRA